jgi:hypothetical protein
MKKIFIVLLFVLEVFASDLYLLNEDGERVGCITCNEYSGDSIWNEYSIYGNEYNSDSIWNEFGTNGNEYNTISPWNEYGTGMKIIDLDGNYYGQFTSNEYGIQTKVPLLKSILDAYNSRDWKSLEEFRDWVAPQIP